MPSAEEELGLYREVTDKRARMLVPEPALKFWGCIGVPISSNGRNRGNEGKREGGTDRWTHEWMEGREVGRKESCLEVQGVMKAS